MELEIFDCIQGSPEWLACRAGIPTASKFATVMASGRGGGESKTREKYMKQLIGERMTGEVLDGFTNAHMERGKVMESEARDLYAMVTDLEPQQIGFMRRWGAGASPDSLIGTDGLLEIKTKLPDLHIDCLEGDRIPPEHIAQCQGALWISGREWLDFVSYWPAMPIFIKRVKRDEAYIARIKVEVQTFIEEMNARHAKLMNYRSAA